MDKSIDDVLEHFVYVPKQSPANPQDIPLFLSTRLADPNATDDDKAKKSRRRDTNKDKDDSRNSKKRKRSTGDDSEGKDDASSSRQNKEGEDKKDDDHDSDGNGSEEDQDEDIFGGGDPVQILGRYEYRAAKLAKEYEENMIRF